MPLDPHMARSPAFSIITICFNEAADIRQTCESIVAQTHADREWIVIDGGSTDGTVGILDEFREHIDCLVSEPDQGIYDAMNKGITKASGEYLVFMNGGDLFASPDALAWVAAAPDKDLIYGDLIFDKPDGELVTYPDQLNTGYLLHHMVPHQATFYRRSLFDRFGRYDTSFRIAADYDLYVRLLEIGGISHHHVPRPLAIFKRDGISNRRDHRQLKKRENHRIRMKYFPSYRWTTKAWRQILRDFIQRLRDGR